MSANDVSAADIMESQLQSAVANVYGGPLDAFVRRRDALVKELRSAGKRESASLVKNLRKPSRLAWALDLAALDDPEAMDMLVAAVAETIDAHTGAGDVRAAIVRLRAAVREFAAHAAHAAEQAGHRIEAGVLGNAVLAVLGTPESFTLLRRGQLADIPEAGGLDFLTALPTLPAQVPRTAPREPPEEANASAPSQEPAGLDSAARAAARQAAIVLADVRARVEVSQRTLHDAESKLHAAEMRLRDAEEQARAARNQRDRAREEVDTAAAQLLDAENAVAEAEQRLKSSHTTKTA